MIYNSFKQGLSGTVGKRMLASLALAAGCSALMAIPSSIDIDFRSASWSGANWRNTYTVGDVTATAYQGSSRDYLHHDSQDGLGIKWDDEISLTEKLVISFGGTSGQGISGVWITDLFGTPDGSGGANGEIGNVTLSNGATHTFYGVNSDQGNGEQYVSFGGAFDIIKAEFFATSDGRDDFSVAGFTRGRSGEPNSVPDGGTSLVFLGVSLLGLACCRKYLKK